VAAPQAVTPMLCGVGRVHGNHSTHRSPRRQMPVP
jgi:hypothetical protein